MGKITIQKRRGNYIITNRLVFPENINDRVLQELSGGTMYRDLLPLKLKKHGRKRELIGISEGGIPLTKLFMNSVSRKLFLDTAYQIGRIIHLCEDHLTPNNLDLQRDRIFADPMTKTIRCVYWPVVNNQRSIPPSRFLRELSYGLTFTPYEDHSYLDRYQDFFSGLRPFSAANFEKLILSLQGKEAPGERQIPGDLGLREEFTGFGTASEQSLQSRMLSNEYIPAAADCIRPVLVRLRTGETAEVNHESFLIGTAAGRCDWLISGNPAISHIHAEIICREGRYYLLDRGTENRGSTNGTCFFGERLLPGVPQELSEDCLIRLADEAFSFRIPIKPLA